MAIICARAEEEHERVLRQTPRLYVLEDLFMKARESGRFLWVRFIDPYGDTVLNQLQIPHFIEEWDRLSELQPSAAEVQALAAVRELAQYCLEKPGRYLRFYGD
jgi:hypothetical protein